MPHERNQIVNEEVERLESNGLIKEVHYPFRLKNAGQPTNSLSIKCLGNKFAKPWKYILMTCWSNPSFCGFGSIGKTILDPRMKKLISMEISKVKNTKISIEYRYR